MNRKSHPENQSVSLAAKPDKVREAIMERLNDADREFIQLISMRLNCRNPHCKAVCKTHAKVFSSNEVDDAVKWARRENRAGNVYVSLASPRKGLAKKAAKDELDLIHVAHFDYDLPKQKMTHDEREAWKDEAWGNITTNLPEGVPEGFEIVDSGGGFNLIWPLDKPLDATPENIELIESINRRIAQAFGAEGASEWNADRILRLAGTVNLPTPTKEKRGREAALARIKETAQDNFALDEFDGLPELAKTPTGGRHGKRSGGKRYDRMSISDNWIEVTSGDIEAARPEAMDWTEDDRKDGSANLASLLWTLLYGMCQVVKQGAEDFDCTDARINLYRLVDDMLCEGDEDQFPLVYWHLTKPDNVRGWEGKLSYEVDQAFNKAIRKGTVLSGKDIPQKKATGFLTRLERIQEKDRLPENTALQDLIDEAAALRLKGFDREKCLEIFADMTSSNTSFDAPTHSKQAVTQQLVEAERKFKIAARKDVEAKLQKAGPTASRDTVPYTEDWLADRFAAENQSRLRYVASMGKWYEWTGTHWGEENTLGVYDRIGKDVRKVAKLLRKSDEGTANTISKAATRSAVETIARADRRIAAVSDQWDRDNWFLNTPSGVVDLRTGKTKTHDPGLYMSKITAVAPGGVCPEWMTFLDRVTDGDKELQSYLQQLAGYMLTGDTAEHALFFVYGGGRNGKGVFINTLARIMANYARNAPAEIFMERGRGVTAHPTELAHLKGARLVTSSELEEGATWNESRIKSMTGGDKITARFMRGDFFDFVPQFKVLIAGNHRPRIKHVDTAIIERLHLVPFLVTIPRKERDPDLPDRLFEDEGGGILQWAIEGCVQYVKTGTLVKPQIVKSATDSYLESQDTTGQWLEDRCEDDPTSGTFLKDLFADWKDFAEENRAFISDSRALSEKLEKRGYEKIKKRNVAFFKGIRLKLLPGGVAALPQSVNVVPIRER